MDEEVQAAELLLDLREDGRDLVVVADVARHHQRVGQSGGQLADVFLETLALIRDRETRSRPRRRIGDRPRDRPLVGDTNDEAVFSGEIGHALRGQSRQAAGAADGATDYLDRLRPPGPCRRAGREGIAPWGGRPATVVPGSGAPRPAGAVAVRPVASKWLPAALMAGPEAIGPAAWLADGELRDGTRGRGLPFSRQRRPNQRAMHRPLFVVRALRPSSSSASTSSTTRSSSGVRSTFTSVSSACSSAIERRVLDRLRTAADVDVVVVLVGRWRRGLMARSRAWAHSRRPAHTARPANPACGAGEEPWRVCIRARCRTSCSGSVSRRRRPSPRRRGSSTAALACSNRPECHQAEAGAVASKISKDPQAGEVVRKADAILAELVSRWQ